jgi:reverse transcriptase-like protein
MGLVCLMEDMCVFSNEYIVVIFFVDDIIPIYHPHNHHKYEEFKLAFQSKYRMRNMGDLQWFLGIRVVENRKLWLCQDSFVEKITHRFHLEDRKPPSTPMSDFMKDLCHLQFTVPPSQLSISSYDDGSVRLLEYMMCFL